MDVCAYNAYSLLKHMSVMQDKVLKHGFGSKPHSGLFVLAYQVSISTQKNKMIMMKFQQVFLTSGQI